MELLLPSLGLIVWTSLAFIIVFILLAKFAWKPILNSLKERETFIQTSLDNAKQAQDKLATIQMEAQELLKQAQIEKSKVINEAQQLKNQIISEAQIKAKEEANKMIDIAKAEILKQQEKAVHEIKKDIASLIISTTEKILQEKLKTTTEQEKLINKAINDISLN